MGRGVWTVELQCIKIKLKEKKWWNHHLGQQFALCGVSSQPITRHLYSMWPSCDFILLWPINTQHGGRGELGKHRSSQITAKLWLGQLKPLVYKRRKKQEIHSRTCDIFVHLRNLCWDFHYVCTENVLQWKKELHLCLLTQEWDRPSKKILLFSLFFFSAYCNCPCLSIQRGRYTCLSFWNRIRKKLLLLTKWTYVSDHRRLKPLRWLRLLLG